MTDKKTESGQELLRPEVTEVNAVEAIERASIDIQIATAHKYPRSITKFKRTAMDMIMQDEETAESCLYSRPVGDGKYAEGMSIRMAEIVGGSYGNLRVGSILIEQTERQVKARGFAHDLESNFAATSEVIESTVTKEGRPFSERMRVTVAKACLAKALRDATFKVVPRALCKSLEDAARKTAIGDTATLEKRRAKVMEWIGKLGIDIKRVYDALKISGQDDIGIKELETLTGLKTAIKEGDTSVEDAFPRQKIAMTTAKAPAAVQEGKTPAEEPASAGPAPAKEEAPSKDQLLTECNALVEKTKASKIKKVADAIKWDWQGGEALEGLSIDQLRAIRSMLKC